MGRLWAGIDEAGYGPNLGPLVMSMVVAEGECPDLWRDCAGRVGRAGADPGLLWVDDSKRIYHGGNGFDRLNAATFAVLHACGGQTPFTSGGLLEAFGAGSHDDAELSFWLSAGSDPVIFTVPPPNRSALCSPVDDRWHLIAARSVVVGPARLNQELDRTGSKAAAHFGVFAKLLGWLWETTTTEASVTSDKHGGRHFYLGPLSEAFPDVWIDRGPEGPDLSQYMIRSGARRLDLRFQPRADGENGLVALASLISKALREHWMAAFNAYWQAVIPGLKPTAGYPVDAARFRAIIEPECQARGLELDQWWRKK